MWRCSFVQTTHIFSSVEDKSLRNQQTFHDLLKKFHLAVADRRELIDLHGNTKVHVRAYFSVLRVKRETFKLMIPILCFVQQKMMSIVDASVAWEAAGNRKSQVCSLLYCFLFQTPKVMSVSHIILGGQRCRSPERCSGYSTC